MKRYLLFLIVATLTFLAAACAPNSGNGGNGGNSSDGGQNEGNGGNGIDDLPLGTLEFDNVTVAPTIQALLGDKQISRIASMVGEVSIGEPVPILRFGAPGRNLVFGFSSDGRTLLIGFSEGTLTLDGASTAAALLELAAAMYIAPGTIDVASVVERGKASSRFPTVVARVEAALRLGQEPFANGAVLQELSALLLDATNSLIGKAIPKAAINGVPYCVLNQFLTEFCFSEGAETNGLKANNATFLAWEVTTSNDRGVIQREIVDPPSNGLLGALISGGSSEQLNGAPMFSVVVKQDEESQAKNINQAIVQAISVFLYSLEAAGQKLADVSCVKQVVTDYLVSGPFLGTSVLQSKDKLVTFFDRSYEIVKSTLIGSCIQGFAGDFFSGFIEGLASEVWAKTIGRITSVLAATNEGVALGMSLEQMYFYNNTTFAFDVCKYQGAVAPCVHRLSGDPLNLVVGQNVQPTIRAFRIDNEIIDPPPFVVTNYADSESREFVEIVPVSGQGTFTVRGIAPGPARLTIADPVTGVSTLINVMVSSCPVEKTSNLSPNGTFLHFNPTPAPKKDEVVLADQGAPPLILDLAEHGVKEGDVLVLNGLGAFDPDGENPQVDAEGNLLPSLPDNDSAICGVFSSTAELLSGSFFSRVPGAIASNGPACSSAPTEYDGEATNISQDFDIRVGTRVTVPEGAKFLFIGANDSFYIDNTDPNGDFSVASIKEVEACAMAR